MYDIVFVPKAEKQLYKLEKENQKKILAVLERISFNPHKYSKKLANSDSFRFRAGNYRIIADILDNKLVVLVLQIKHRRNVYK